jgi:hypothetical protein
MIIQATKDWSLQHPASRNHATCCWKLIAHNVNRVCSGECEQIRVHMNRSHVTWHMCLDSREVWILICSQFTQSSHVQFTCELRENESNYSLDQFTCALIRVNWSIRVWTRFTRELWSVFRMAHVKCTCELWSVHIFITYGLVINNYFSASRLVKSWEKFLRI